MKKDIHPSYNEKAKVTCACGNSFEVGSTVEKINVEICSACHPFYTGKQKLVDTARRVEKFEAKSKKAESLAERKGKKAKKEKQKELQAGKKAKVKTDDK